MRVGHGFDAHRFAEGDSIVLGGERIAFDRSLAAHSDGDVLVHAVCDALLGALALGDIGQYFPDGRADLADIDSRLLLRQAVAMLVDRSWQVVNVDATVIAQRPRLSPYVASMRANLAADLQVAFNAVSIKATTTEGMGYTGRGEGVAAHAVVLVAPRSHG